MLIKVDKANKFVSKFNPKTGLYIRSGIIENGVDTGVDPYMTEYPELIDIGIMGHCLHGLKSLCIKSGVECYQNGQGKVEPNMPLDDYKKLMDESEFRTYQVAIGGRGDPNKHKEFKEILQYSRQRNIVPNYTTSGLDLTDEEAGISAELCGAVAVSWYRTDYTLSAIEKLLKYKCTVNIHYVLANNSIDEAISRLRSLDFPDNIHAVIFLLHKPVGQGSQDNVIKLHDPRLAEFFKEVDRGERKFRIGFDSCTTPAIVNFSKNIKRDTVEACDAGRWSMYVTPDMKATPCSFDNQGMRWAFDLRGSTIEEAWNSEPFRRFRSYSSKSCTSCGSKSSCYGGCPITPEITLCDRPTRDNPASETYIQLGIRR